MRSIYDYTNDTELVEKDAFYADHLDLTGRVMITVLPATVDESFHTVKIVDEQDFAYDRGDLDGLVDEGEWLTPAATETVAEVIKDILHDRWDIPFEFLDAHLMVGDLARSTLTVLLTYPVGSGTVQELMGSYAIPLHTTMTHILNPDDNGDYPYLWEKVREVHGLS